MTDNEIIRKSSSVPPPRLSHDRRNAFGVDAPGVLSAATLCIGIFREHHRPSWLGYGSCRDDPTRSASSS